MATLRQGMDTICIAKTNIILVHVFLCGANTRDDDYAQ